MEMGAPTLALEVPHLSLTLQEQGTALLSKSERRSGLRAIFLALSHSSTKGTNGYLTPASAINRILTTTGGTGYGQGRDSHQSHPLREREVKEVASPTAMWMCKWCGDYMFDHQRYCLHCGNVRYTEPPKTPSRPSPPFFSSSHKRPTRTTSMDY